MGIAMADIEAAKKLNEKVIVVDAHHDIAIDIVRRRALGERGVFSNLWGRMLHSGGINIQILPIMVADSFLPELGLRNILQSIDAVLNDLEDDDSVLRLATNVSDIDRLLAKGKIVGVLALEGCDGLGGDLAMLRVLYRLGVRMVSLTWNRRNEFADGVGLESYGSGGLSSAGLEALREMNEHHVLCDVSHLAEPGFWDVATHCQGPFIASHSNARAICDHPRNLTDEQLHAVAESRGVVGICFYGGYIDPSDLTASRLVDHIAHIADTIGIEHVGIGSDFLEDGLLDEAKSILAENLADLTLLDLWIPDCRRCEQLPRLTSEMMKRGFSDSDIEKVMGANFMRVFREVWS